MKSDKRDLCIQAIRKDMTILLEPLGFYRCDTNWWIRKWGWKTDVIYFSKKIGILINLCVWIPPKIEPGSNFDHDEISMINLGKYIGLKSHDHKFPFWGSYDSFRKKIIQDMKKGMNWFESFITPQSCLNYLKEHAWNPSSPSTLYCREYLSSLPPETAKGGVISNLQQEYQNEFSRVLFDLNYKAQLPKNEGDEEDDE